MALGAETTAFCISSLVLPYIQKWLRRLKYEDDTRNVKQAIGTCTEIVMQYIDQHKGNFFSTSLSLHVKIQDDCSHFFAIENEEKLNS